MRAKLSRSLILIAALGVMPASAAAADKKAESKDPNRMICEKQGVSGSRLATRRVCMTAAEWEIRKLEDRQAIEKGQVRANGIAGN